MFFDKYKLTHGIALEPKFRKVAKNSPWNTMSSGLYNRGIVTVFDIEYDDSFLTSWDWLVGNNVILLGGTCWGDFFYADMNEGEFYIVLVDQYKKFPMGNSFSAVFDKNLAVDNFYEQILRPSDFSDFQTQVGQLDYGEFYFNNPRTGARERKSFSLALDVIGQTGRQLSN